ncbi:MAG: hypothetical protein LBU36_03605 [Clostridiales bacterium]|jgi:hypothetical protein|nr:hypothetical protein [Clostridiales bacterium]
MPVRLMELFVDTLQKCGTRLLEMSDEDVGYCIFEEFDIGSASFLHEDALLKLKEANLITEEISQKSIVLRNKFIEIQNTEQWNIQSVRESREWREILELSDEIKNLLPKR